MHASMHTHTHTHTLKYTSKVKDTVEKDIVEVVRLCAFCMSADRYSL